MWGTICQQPDVDHTRPRDPDPPRPRRGPCGAVGRHHPHRGRRPRRHLHFRRRRPAAAAARRRGLVVGELRGFSGARLALASRAWCGRRARGGALRPPPRVASIYGRGDWIRTSAESARTGPARASRTPSGGCGPTHALRGVHPRNAPCSQGASPPTARCLRRFAATARLPRRSLVESSRRGGQRKGAASGAGGSLGDGRGDWIRTSDLLNPIQVRYQICATPRRCGRGECTLGAPGGEFLPKPPGRNGRRSQGRPEGGRRCLRSSVP